MWRRKVLQRLVIALVAGTVALTSPAYAQMRTDGSKFLSAVKDKKVDDVIELLAEPGNTIINSRDLTTGETALHIVVQRRDVTWINFLTQRGANPNVRDNKGLTPLVLASQLGFVDGVEALVAAHANVDEPNSAGETPLIAAVHQRDLQLMRILLKAGADPDRTDNSGRSARDYARLSNSSSTLLGEIERNEKKDDNKDARTYGPSF